MGYTESMSKYPVGPFDASGIRTYPLKDRPSKVDVGRFGRPHTKGASVSEFLEGLPGILAAQGLRDLAHAIASALPAGKPVLWGMGGHVIKTGLAPIVIDLMDRGFVSGIALNGRASFTTSRSPGRLHQRGCAEPARSASLRDVRGNRPADQPGHQRRGCGRPWGSGSRSAAISPHARPPYARYSILTEAYLRRIPVTVHVTIGADIVHNQSCVFTIRRGGRLLPRFPHPCQPDRAAERRRRLRQLQLRRDPPRSLPEVRHARAQLRRPPRGLHDREPRLRPALPPDRERHPAPRRQRRARYRHHGAPRAGPPAAGGVAGRALPGTRSDA